ncbi:MAG: SGNH/GDSL hydrolase family protein [Bdellovibrionota bacterium]
MLRKLLVSLGSVMVVLLLLEAFVRVFPSQEFSVNSPYKYVQIRGIMKTSAPLWRYREVYPLEFDPRGYYRASGGNIDYYFDQYSGRWKEAEKRKLGKRVVVALGDSLTYGFGLRFEDTFIARLSSLLRADFVNLAREGGDVVSALAVYREHRAEVPHQAVVFGLHLNDLIEFPTSFVISNPLLRDDSFWQQHLHLLPYVLKKWDHSYGRAARLRRITDPAAFALPQFTKNFGALLQLRDLAAEKHRSFRVVILPVLVELKSHAFAAVFAELRRRLDEAGIAYVDLSGDWDQYNDQDLWITPFDQHPNEIANRIFADRIAIKTIF